MKMPLAFEQRGNMCASHHPYSARHMEVLQCLLSQTASCLWPSSFYHPTTYCRVRDWGWILLSSVFLMRAWNRQRLHYNKVYKKWAVLGLARDCIHGPHVVHSCGRLIHNGKLWWDTYYQPSYCLQEVMSAVGSVCIADGNINTSYIQYILRYKRRHRVYQAIWLTNYSQSYFHFLLLKENRRTPSQRMHKESK